MAKWVCTVCGDMFMKGSRHLGADKCKKHSALKFQNRKAELSWAAEHVVGVAKGV